MHIKRNILMNVFDIVMEINGRTKDTHNDPMDTEEICNRKELELKDIVHVKLFKPKEAYALIKSQRVVKELKLPDGYTSNLSKYINLNQGNLHGMKSHDCHVFMQRLLLIAFNSLPKHIWKPLIELCHFFRELTLITLNVEKLRVMEDNIHVLLCKLEQIFPPTRAEASIWKAYLVEVTSTFASFHYLDKIEMRRTKMPHNVDVGEAFSSTPPIAILNYPRRVSGKSITYFLTKLTSKLLTYKELNPTGSDVQIDQDMF
ncbi:hypothetical protein CR513_22545, partial [Mucuna pruriens]